MSAVETGHQGRTSPVFFRYLTLTPSTVLDPRTMHVNEDSTGVAFVTVCALAVRHLGLQGIEKQGERRRVRERPNVVPETDNPFASSQGMSRVLMMTILACVNALLRRGAFKGICLLCCKTEA